MEEKKNQEDDSDSHMSIFNESLGSEEMSKDDKEGEKKGEKKKEEENILKFEEKFLKKKRRVLTEKEKQDRIKLNIERYCKRNNEMLELLEKISNGETTHKNINSMMRLLAIDLSDTKRLINRRSQIYIQKKQIFERLLNLTYRDYQLFWHTLTNGKLKRGNAQLIKSSNISTAKEILRKIEEEGQLKNEKDNDKNKEGENSIKETGVKEKTVREIIQAADKRDQENAKIDEEFLCSDSAISSESSLSSSLNESEEEDDEDSSNKSKSMKKSEKKEEKEKKEKEKKEKEEMEKKKKEQEEKERKEKEKKEKEEKEKKEKEKKEKEEREKKLKQMKDEEDDIDIFN